jgi:hypothetical protein
MERDRLRKGKGGYGRGGRHKFVCSTNSAKLEPALSCRCQPSPETGTPPEIIVRLKEDVNTRHDETATNPSQLKDCGSYKYQKLFFLFCTATKKCRIMS